jgi:glycosyltransferase involved in cell wall biosynthesis
MMDRLYMVMRIRGERVRVGVVGATGPDDFATHIVDALVRLGHDPVSAALPLPRTNAQVITLMARQAVPTLDRRAQQKLARALIRARCDVVINIDLRLMPEVVAGLRDANIRTAFWFPDAVSNLGRQYMMLAPYDALFFKDPHMVAHLSAFRVRAVHYLPEACNPRVHRPDGPAATERHLVVAGSAGGLAVGQRNAAFYRKYRARAVTFAPHSVDNASFAADPAQPRADLLRRLGLPAGRPVVMFCGKLQPHKRPLDLIAAAGRLTEPVTLLFVGDGPLAGQVAAALAPGAGAVTGFVNQAELPAYYHAADILVLPSAAEPWGMVVNEAMAAGVLPVVSDRVGAGQDLVAGLGEIYRCGDTAALAAALDRAVARLDDAGLAKLIAARVDRYGIEQTAAGFERAAARARH